MSNLSTVDGEKHKCFNEIITQFYTDMCQVCCNLYVARNVLPHNSLIEILVGLDWTG